MIINSDYKNKINKELEWWKGKKKGKNIISRILNSSIFYDPFRSHFSYVLSKIQMKNYMFNYLGNTKYQKMLIAPCGFGDDYKYFKSFSDEVYGIDISPIAINNCHFPIKVKVGDILNSGYPNDTFNIIICNLFFHHMVKIGFSPFLNEFFRILKPGGLLAILDFSIFYPLNIITRTLKKILKNPYGEIEDEGPFRPKLMVNSLISSGFINIKLWGTTFSHCSFFIPFAKFIHRITKPILDKWPFKNFAWLVFFFGEKPKQL